MNQIAIIGLSSFGSYLARALAEQHIGVLVIDNNEAIIDGIKSHVTKAVIADATDPNIIQELSLNEMDHIIISLGTSIESSILTALHLIESGITNITAKAISEDHVKILETIGVKDIVFPERDMGLRLASSLAKSDILDFIPLDSNFSIVEKKPTEEMLGRTLSKLDFRNKYKCQVVAIKTTGKKQQTIMPYPNTIISEDQTLIIVGENEDIEKI